MKSLQFGFGFWSDKNGRQISPFRLNSVMLRHHHLLLLNMKLFHMPTNSILLSYCWIMLPLHPFLPGGLIWWEPWSGLLCYFWAIMRVEITFIFDKGSRSRPLCPHPLFPKHLLDIWIFKFFQRISIKNKARHGNSRPQQERFRKRRTEAYDENTSCNFTEYALT